MVTWLACMSEGAYIVLYNSRIASTAKAPSRFLAGLGCGAATMVNPLYISENAPRAIRGALTGLYQLFNTIGAMLAFWVNYGCDLHISGPASYIVPLILQAIPSTALFVGMYLCNESP